MNVKPSTGSNGAGSVRIRSITGLHIYYYFGHVCDYQLRRTVMDTRPSITDPGVLLLLEQGRENEARYVEALRQSGLDVQSDKDGTMEERAVKTMAMMQAGASVIHNGVLDGGDVSRALSASLASQGINVRFRGETDLLFRVDGQKSAWGNYSYRVCDVKSSRTGRLPQMMQVAFYDWLLRAVQGASFGEGSVVVFPNGPQGEPVEEFFSLDPLEPSLNLLLTEKIRDVLDPAVPEPNYHLVPSCKRCLWFGHCSERALREDDLSRVPGLRSAQKNTLRRAGIPTAAALAQADDAAIQMAAANTGSGGDGLLRLRTQARAILTSTILDKAPISVVATDWTAEYLGRAVDFRKEPARQIALALEEDPIGGIEFAYGVRMGKNPPQFFAAESPTQEDLAYYRFIEGMEKVHKSSAGRFFVFHYGARERFALKRLAEKYPRPEIVAVVDTIVPRLVDLQAILRRAFFLPADGLSLREVVSFVNPNADRKSTIPTTESALVQALLAEGWEPGEIEAASADLARAATRIGVPFESLLQSPDDRVHVWYRMHAERQEPLWMQLIEWTSKERLQHLHLLWEWLVAKGDAEAPVHA